MSAYPDLSSGVSIVEPLGGAIEFRTLLSEFEGGAGENRKQKRLYPRRHFQISYKRLEQADITTLWAFYLACKGSFGAFNLFIPWSASYAGEYVATGDGESTIFNLPSKSASSYTLYLDGAALTGGGADYTFTAQGGADNADKIELTVAPADGSRLTFDFTGTLKVRSRFAEDSLEYQIFAAMLFTSGLKTRGLLNA